MSMILKEIFNEDLLKLAIWLNENKLTLNLNKTRSMIIDSGRKLCNISSMTVSVNNTEISNASNFNYLGVTITANFTWSEHIDRISAKVNQRLGLLRRIKHLLPFNARILFLTVPYSQSLTMRMLYDVIRCYWTIFRYSRTKPTFFIGNRRVKHFRLDQLVLLNNVDCIIDVYLFLSV
jgi:hypothetical protein